MAHQARFEKQADLLLGFLDGEECHLCTVDEVFQNRRVALAVKTAWRERRIVAIDEIA